MEIWLLILICLVASVALVFITLEITYQITLKRNSLLCRYIGKYLKKREKCYGVDVLWWNIQKFKHINIQSGDNLFLGGKLLECKNTKKFVIVVHGFGQVAKHMQAYTKIFYEQGYSTLTIDNRGHGHSDGEHITMGAKDYEDVLCWVEYLKTTYKKCEIVLFGLSMGASTVCLASGEKLPKNVKAIISDCGFSSAYQEIIDAAKKRFILIRPFLILFNWYLHKRAKYFLSDINVKQAVAKTNVPILFIHGTKDEIVPFEMQQELFESTKKGYAHKYVVCGAKHAMSYASNPKDYVLKVQEFLNMAFEEQTK